MDKHPRQTIREAVAAALAFKTKAGDRVFTNREVPWKRVELPGIAVYTPDESIDQGALVENPGASLRTLTIEVEVVVEAVEKIDDEFDARALEVETAISAAENFEIEAVTFVRLRETNTTQGDVQGRPVGVVKLTYDVGYLSNL